MMDEDLGRPGGLSSDGSSQQVVSPVPASIPDAQEWDCEDEECWNCGGEGFVYGCSWDWQCNTYDAGEGTCLCTRRCEICNPPKLTPEAIAEREALRQLLARSIDEATQALQEQDNG